MGDGIIIVGAGPAGPDATCTSAKRGREVVCLRGYNIVDGISHTVSHDGFRFDVGGHRFFTKIGRFSRLRPEIQGRNPEPDRKMENHCHNHGKSGYRKTEQKECP